jgi:hypothetical protein
MVLKTIRNGWSELELINFGGFLLSASALLLVIILERLKTKILAFSALSEQKILDCAYLIIH